MSKYLLLGTFGLANMNTMFANAADENSIHSDPVVTQDIKEAFPTNGKFFYT